MRVQSVGACGRGEAGAHARWEAGGRPLPRAGYSQTAPSTPDRRHSQRYHHVMPSSCADDAELTDDAAAPPGPLMLPPSGAARHPYKRLGGGRGRPARCLVGEEALISIEGGAGGAPAGLALGSVGGGPWLRRPPRRLDIPSRPASGPE